VIAKSLLEITDPEKRVPFQPTMIPPEAPCEGTNANLLKRFGANFLTSERVKYCLFVSCKHTIAQELSSILA
jgi:hypothetical protein